MDKKTLAIYTLLGLLAIEGAVGAYLLYKLDNELGKSEGQFNNLEQLLQNMTAKENNTIIIIKNTTEENNYYYYFNGNNVSKTYTTPPTSTSNNVSCNNIECFEQEYNQSELSTFGTNSEILVLKVLNVSPSGNFVDVWNPYNNKSMVILQSPGFSSFNPYGTSESISIRQILQSLDNGSINNLVGTNSKYNLYLVLKVNNKDNITKSGIVNLGNGSVEILPNAYETYVIGPQSPLSLEKILYNAYSNPGLPVLLVDNIPDNQYVPYSTFGGIYNNGSFQSILIQALNQSEFNNILSYVKIAGYLLGNASMQNPGHYGMVIALIPNKVFSYYSNSAGSEVMEIKGNYSEFIMFNPEQGNGYIFTNQVLHKDPTQYNGSSASQYLVNLKGFGSGDLIEKVIAGSSLSIAPYTLLRRRGFINRGTEDFKVVFSE